MPDASDAHNAGTETKTVAAGRLQAWEVDELPPSPPTGFRHWKTLIGPGLLMAGAAIGAGEWLFGPAVSAQFGGTLLWLATISIVLQVFMNLECMRYALYCGEPILVGYFRTFPGPRFWTAFFLILELSAIWPFLAANAAVPLAAAIFGHLPGDASVTLVGSVWSETEIVQALGYVIFLVSFIPLIFGGSVYRMIERIMTIKIVLVLGFFIFVTSLTVSSRNAKEVVSGFLQFGAIPRRADTVIDGRHFTLTERDESATYTIQGTVDDAGPLVTGFIVQQDDETVTYKMGQPVPAEHETPRATLLEQALDSASPDRFTVEQVDETRVLRVTGTRTDGGVWQADEFTVTESGSTNSAATLEDVDEPAATIFRELLDNSGLQRENIVGYIGKHGGLPPLDWALLAAFFSIAGAGGITNALMANYVRDKGWGMGAKVGAIPSAVGGRNISLSHTGKVFELDETTRSRWRGWMRHIYKDQLVIWLPASLLGVALPCMVSLQFIRNAPVSGHRVAAMTADGIANQYPAYGELLWALTLSCAFLVLFPGLIMGTDAIARRWTDIIWVGSKRAQSLDGNKVKLIYYSIVSAYCVWGLFALSLFDPLQIAKLGASLGTVALGATALHTLYVNRTYLPPEIRPNWFMQLGLAGCGVAFLGMSIIVVLTF